MSCRHEDGTAVHIVKRMSNWWSCSSGRTDDGDLVTGFGFGGEIIDDDLVFAIARVNVLNSTMMPQASLKV